MFKASIHFERALLLFACCFIVPALGASCRLGSDECLTGEDCGSGEACSRTSSSCGICNDPAAPCGKDADCGGTQVCVPAHCPCNPGQGQCVEGCTSNDYCDSPETCDTATGHCGAPSCKDDDECGDNYCHEGSCTKAGGCVSGETPS